MTPSLGKPDGDQARALLLRIETAPENSSDGDAHHTLVNLSQEIDAHASGESAITVLGVMVFGGSYPEQAELRRRWRYAVISALATSGYAPEHSDRIGYYKPGRYSHLSLPSIVPYEWFVPMDGKKGDVLVLWIDDGRLVTPTRAKVAPTPPDQSPDSVVSKTEPRPLHSLVEMLAALKRNALATPRLNAKIIGPAGTTTLKAMAEERPMPGDTQYESALKAIAPLTIYSATATGDDCLVLDKPLWCKDKVSEVINRGLLAQQGELRLIRTIDTDSNLAKTLAGELSLRDALRPGSHVVLISEWDTDYGRALPKVTTRAIRNYADVHVDEFSYLRGLDGLLPGESPPSEPAQKSQGEAPEAFEKERPTGRPRYDYLRRVVHTIERRSDDLAKNHQRIRAVGVLGSDFYDKQLILQAMRPVLTNVLFFTTDLDARLLHPADFKWNRNLIIASSYGLQSAPALQRAIPSFRSGYQTSIYLAGLCALNGGGKDCMAEKKRPHIFEVGRSGAFDLTGYSKDPEEGAAPAHEGLAAALAAGPVYPKPEPFFPRSQTWWEAFWIGIVSLILFAYMSTTVKLAMEEVWRKRRRYWAPVLVLVLGVAVAGWALFQALRLEPFSLFDGISAWPSTLLRVLASALALIFVVVGWKKLATSDAKLNAFMLQGQERSAEGKIRSTWVLIWTVLLWPFIALSELFRRERVREKGRQDKFETQVRQIDLYPIYSWRRDANDKPVSGETVWAEYQERAHADRRLARISIAFLGYSGILIGLVLTSDPNIPVRGVIGVRVAEAISLASFTFLSLLTFLVVDATRLCRRLVEILSERNVYWDESTKEKFTKMRHDETPHDEWITLDVVSEEANTVAELIVYPFVVLFIVVISGLSFFDNWDTPLAVALIYLTLATYAFVSVFILHRAAERARRFAVDALEDQMIANYHKKETAEEFRILIERIRSMHHGAFRPLTEQPLLKALLLPFGGGLGLIILDYLNWLN